MACSFVPDSAHAARELQFFGSARTALILGTRANCQHAHCHADAASGWWQDLIQSELAGLAFDGLQQVFRKGDIALAFDTVPLPIVQNQTVFVVVDPAAGGPQSDYAVVSIVRTKGCVTVSGVRRGCRSRGTGRRR